MLFWWVVLLFNVVAPRPGNVGDIANQGSAGYSFSESDETTNVAHGDQTVDKDNTVSVDEADISSNDIGFPRLNVKSRPGTSKKVQPGRKITAVNNVSINGKGNSSSGDIERKTTNSTTDNHTEDTAKDRRIDENHDTNNRSDATNFNDEDKDTAMSYKKNAKIDLDNLTEDVVSTPSAHPGYTPWGYRVVTGNNEISVNVPFTTNIDDIGVKHYIKRAMAQWGDRTCVSFVPRSSETNYTNFVLNTLCSSMVGMSGGEQNISLGVGCRYEGKILHEIGHALGLIHEHARPDRDSFITINTHNIQPGRVYNFEKESDPGYLKTDNYDYMSIMHYSEDSFSNSSEPTIQTLDTRYQSLIGQRLYLTQLDVEKVNMLYHCSCQYNNRTTTRDVKKYDYPCYYKWDVLEWLPYKCIIVVKVTEWCLEKRCYNTTTTVDNGVHWVKDKMCYI